MRTFSPLVASLGLAACALALSTSSQQQQNSWSYDNCGLDTDAIHIESIEVSPDPPQPGRNMSVKVKADVREEIEEGAYVDFSVKLGLVKLLEQQFDLCDEALSANVSVHCPIQQGSYTIEQTVALPKEVPKAKFIVDVQGYTDDDDDMFCLKLKVDFMKRPF